MLWLEGRHDDKHVQQNVWSTLVGGGTAPEGTPRGPPWGDICFGGLPLQGVARSQWVPRVGRPGTTQIDIGIRAFGLGPPQAQGPYR